MPTIERHVLTADLLAEEFGDDAGYIDDAGAMAAAEQRTRGMIAALAALPEGYRIERVQGRVGIGEDPGAEYTVLDERGRTVAKVMRRRIGRQRISWTPKQLGEVEHAQAIGAALMLVCADAEGRKP